jgi:isoaspartyl peptidase/L-asparaginase-like protein (Ntn-hydrolase superfamily)
MVKYVELQDRKNNIYERSEDTLRRSGLRACISRRDFVKATAGLGLGSFLLAPQFIAQADTPQNSPTGQASGIRQRLPLPAVISTWPFGKKANDVAQGILAKGGDILDAVERGINVIEADPQVTTVGYGGFPNREGVVELDAAIMSGPGHRAGSVAALQGIMHPVSVARKVMEKTSHVMLVGEGALRFALTNGFKEVNLLTQKSQQMWLDWKEQHLDHDTVGTVVLDLKGDLAVGCSTSGLRAKLPGRVGDSPIIGAGLYVDNDVGGASATGVGEEIMKHCACFAVVERMRAGLSPQQACQVVLERIVEKNPADRKILIGLIALSKRGKYGAASIKKGFSYAICSPEGSFVKEADFIVR